jgi:tripartite-type tricarboxylate transporter receptor subunit TctC
MRQLLGYVLALLCVVSTLEPAPSQAFPDRSVHIIVPTTPGGAIDTIARIVAAKLSEIWSKPVIVENRPGGSMILGTSAAAKAPPDGYTLLVAHDGAIAMNPIIYPAATYDSRRDFAPIALLSSFPYALTVNPAVPATTMAELVALAKARPGQLNHATGGPGTRLALELLKAVTDTDIKHIPYRGGVPAVTDTISGQADVCIVDLTTGSSGIDTGKLRVLAVTGRERSKRLPAVPTVAEAGFPGFELSSWIGIFAPARTPEGVLGKIRTDMKQVLSQPDVVQRIEQLNMDVGIGSADDLATVVNTDIVKWSTLVRERGIVFQP